jgi:hypothetical protein
MNDVDSTRIGEPHVRVGSPDENVVDAVTVNVYRRNGPTCGTAAFSPRSFVLAVDRSMVPETGPWTMWTVLENFPPECREGQEGNLPGLPDTLSGLESSYMPSWSRKTAPV